MTDQAPDDFETIRQLLATVARQQETTQSQLDQLAANQLLVRQDGELAAHQLGGRVDQVAATIEAIAQHADQRMERLSDRVDQVAATIEAIAQQAEQDRNQAAIDRAEFRSTVQQILDALQVRFGGNGHGSE